MTDPKPATPANDDYVPDYPNWGFGGGSHLEYQAQLAWESRYGLAVDSNPVIKLIKQRARLIQERDERDDRIAADAEIIKAKGEEIDRCHEVISDFSDRIDKQAEEIERLKSAKADDGNEYAYVMTLREQVRVLREALAGTVSLRTNEMKAMEPKE